MPLLVSSIDYSRLHLSGNLLVSIRHTSGYTLYGRSLRPFPTFRAANPWRGGDLQTIKNNLVWQAPVFSSHRQHRVRLAMNDGTGDVLLALLDRPENESNLPLLILVHGLTGAEDSRNIMISAAYFVSLGFPVLRLNLRGAGPSSGTCKEHYHAGRSQDLDAATAALPGALKTNGIVMAGISLGGNTLLKFASEQSAHLDIIAYATVCAPIDLKAAQQRIMAPRNSIYHRHLLKHMKAGAYAHASDKLEVKQTLEHVTSVYLYDDLIVAPQNGFDGAEDYYTKSSAYAIVGDIKAPTLLIHAKTDPWIPTPMYTDLLWPGDGPLTLIVSDDGGHVGFHGHDNAVPWHNLCIGQFFLDIASSSR